MAALRRFYHGLDPESLTLKQFNGYLDRMADLLEMENGTGDSWSRRMRRWKRQAEDS